MEGSEAKAHVTGAEESATQVGNAEESVTTVASNAAEDAAETSDAGSALQDVIVFEDAEYFGAEFESFWNRLFSNYSAYDETSEFARSRYLLLIVSFSLNFVLQPALLGYIYILLSFLISLASSFNDAR
jgi:hypothetical protein